MSTDLEVSGIDGQGRDFLNRRRATKRDDGKGKQDADKSRTDGKKPKPPLRPAGSGDGLVDFLA